MPTYIYCNPETEEIREIVQTMSEDHVYFGEKDEPKIKWNRVYSVPTASIDSKIDPFNNAQFVDESSKKKGSVGDLWERSRELSEKRSKIIGEDPVKRKMFDQYSKERRGLKHPLDKPKKINKNGTQIEF